jgi:ketosteroid isomerase-like protein
LLPNLSYGAVHVFTVRGGEIIRFREFTDLDGPTDPLESIN